MKAFKDFTSHYYIVPDGARPIARNPRIVFIRRLPKDAVELPEDDAAFVLLAFVDAAQRNGGDTLAIHHLQEIYMAKAKGFLCVDLLASPAVIAHIFAFEKEAHEKVASGGQFDGKTIIIDEAQFNALTVEQRCELSRPLLNDKEKAETPDGPGLADIAFKICQRFKNPKPAAAGKTPAPGAAPKPAKEPKPPREKGVKSQIFDHFTTNKDTALMSVEEIMAMTSGTKASVTTAISDLRSATYAGKQGVMKLVRVNGKYCLEGSALEASAKADEAAAAQLAADAKAAAKAEKKATAEAKAKEVADAKAVAA